MRREGSSTIERALAAVEAEDGLDRPAHALADMLSTSLQVTGRAAQPIQNALHGVWLGHPLHPMLVTVPIGAWTIALGLDAADAAGLRRNGGTAAAADAALKVAVGGGVLAGLAGLADWRETHGRDRRLGLVHAGFNSAALGLTLGSLAQRRQGRRGLGRLLSAAGWLAMFAGGYLGGHMVYRRRLGVDHADRSPEPRAFRPVAELSELAEGRPHRVEVWDPKARGAVGVALVRRGDEVHALGARCSHLGGPLDDGWVQDGGLVCPWHGSRFCLRSGRVLDGPSTAPQPRYEVRIRNGRVEVRAVPEPGDEVVVPEAIGARPDGRDGPDPPAGAKKADEVLFEHHQLLRRLFEEIQAMPREDPERRDLLRVLASELEIHEHVEDAIFYPAVRPVSEDVPLAHAEHQQLGDMLALTLRLGTSTPEFDAQLRALHAAVDHHARSEETSMFVEAQRLGDRRLRQLGHDLERLLEEERTSRFRRAFRGLKTRLLEGP